MKPHPFLSMLHGDGSRSRLRGLFVRNTLCAKCGQYADDKIHKSPTYDAQHKTFFRRCQHEVTNLRSRVGAPLPFVVADVRDLVAMYLGYKCRYCDETITLANFSLDHAIPLARGGENNIGNLDVCCKRCNRRKGPLTRDAFEQLLADLEKHQPKDREYVLRKLSVRERWYGKRRS